MKRATTLLPMGAGRAARAFSCRYLRRSARHGWMPWRPVALCWRRDAAGVWQRPGMPRPAPRAGDATWKLHMHVRVDGLAPGRSALARAQVDAPRVLHLPPTPLRPAQGRTIAQGRVPHRPPPLEARSKASMLIVRAGPHTVPTIAAARPAAARQSPAPWFARRPVVTVMAAKGKAQPVARERTWLSPARPPLHRPQMPTSTVRHSPASAVPSLVDVLGKRPAELAWRTLASTVRDVAAAGRTLAVAMPSNQQAATPPDAPATSTPAFARQAVPDTPLLEPGMVERLADDVIRRIDRRMRIERERRGL